ncbi:MAG TPA: hypothetical protein VJ915_12330 [Balneolaceae bacterium]|nr:hypothetical protein [Balneolaceae bacterium]
MLLKNLLVTALVLVLSYAPAAFSQSSANDSYNGPDKSLSINLSNLYCFQNLQCLKTDNPYKGTDLSDINLNSMKEKYIVQGNSKNEQLYAEYDGKTGNLIKATVIQRNIRLPHNILATISTGENTGWTMAGNTRVIKNFMEDSIKYEVVLIKDGELRIKYFDVNGMTIDPII